MFWTFSSCLFGILFDYSLSGHSFFQSSVLGIFMFLLLKSRFVLVCFL